MADKESQSSIDSNRPLPYIGRNQLSYCTMDVRTLRAPILNLFTLTNARLQYIFNSETDDLAKSFEDLKKIVDDRTFKYEAMISFWLATHMNKLPEA
jgi:hypothetical protein